MSFLKGYRTHIVNAVRGIASFALIAGYQFDPDLVIGWIDEFWGLWLAAEALLLTGVSYFRKVAQK